MVTMIGAELSFVAGIGGVILQLALLVIVFSLPGRFKEQQEYMDKRLDAIEAKLDALLAENSDARASVTMKTASDTDANKD